MFPRMAIMHLVLFTPAALPINEKRAPRVTAWMVRSERTHAAFLLLCWGGIALRRG